MKIVRLHKPLDEVLRILHEMKSDGYVQGKDFDFAYHQSRWDAMIGEIPTMTDFTFYTDELSLIFALKYGN